GAQSADMVVYAGDSLLLASSIELGGSRFSEDVARVLGIAYQDAEAVKLQHGYAVTQEETGRSLIELPAPPGRQSREIPRKDLTAVLECRARQLFRWVRKELGRVLRDGELLGGLALCGGAARLPGMCDVAEAVVGCDAYLGLPRCIRDWPAALNDPAWTTAAGLAMYSARLKQREREGRRGFLSRIFG
ncbi:MAG: cell division FtsA domain-containing protein, partial [Bryobacteraceae bacterium]